MKSKTKPCDNCPFLRGKEWVGAYGRSGNAVAKIMALEHTDEVGIFSCHKKHPVGNVFMGVMEVNDCVGFKMMKENMDKRDTHPAIVNEFNETGPDFDLKYWAKKEGYVSKHRLI